MSALSIGRRRALAFRLLRHHLLSPAASASEAASSLFGAQAQVHSAGVLQLRARCPTVDEAEIRRALLDDRSLVKIWAQRSTLHLFPQADLPLLLALRRHAVPTYRNWFMREGLDADQIDRLVLAIGEALVEGPASRTDLSNRLVPLLGEWARPWLEHSWGGAMKLAAALGLACHGPPREREATFVRLSDWAGIRPEVDEPGVNGPGVNGPGVNGLDAEGAALGAVARRYLATYGPATARDFARFTGLAAPTARAGFAAIAEELIPIEIDGLLAHALARDEEQIRAAEMPPGELTVLPLFDPWLLAHADTADRLPTRRRSAVYRTAGWISAVVLREGEVAAVWSYERNTAGWRAELAPFKRLGKREVTRIDRQLHRLAGGAVELSVVG
jgi:hypothetical protein